MFETPLYTSAVKMSRVCPTSEPSSRKVLVGDSRASSRHEVRAFSQYTSRLLLVLPLDIQDRGGRAGFELLASTSIQSF